MAGAGDNHTLVTTGRQCLGNKESQQHHNHSVGPALFQEPLRHFKRWEMKAHLFNSH
jgi:hypothetical protein